MSTADQERDFWEKKGETLQTAVEAIAADESAWSGEVLEKCLELILPHIDSAPHRKDHGPRVLDLGCGAGRLTIPIAKRRKKFELVGLDISQNMLNLARDRASSAGVPAIRWMQCDGRLLPDDVGRLDAAYSMITMQHIPREGQARYIEQIGERLVRGGIFRFQNLDGDEDSFLHHYIDEAWLDEVCPPRGMKVALIERYRPFGGNPDAPNAIWVTLVKK